LEDTNASLALNPDSYKALRTRARIHLELEHFEDAVRDFKAAQESAEGDGTAMGEVRSIAEEVKKAEVLLKRSKTKDYYKILSTHTFFILRLVVTKWLADIARDCADSEIKKAYRRESLIHHPDKVHTPVSLFLLSLTLNTGWRRGKVQNSHRGIHCPLRPPATKTLRHGRGRRRRVSRWGSRPHDGHANESRRDVGPNAGWTGWFRWVQWWWVRRGRIPRWRRRIWWGTYAWVWILDDACVGYIVSCTTRLFL
jgi:hypothetical protein